MSRLRDAARLSAGVAVCVAVAHATLRRSEASARPPGSCPIPVFVDDHLACAPSQQTEVAAHCTDAAPLTPGDTLVTLGCLRGRMAPEDLQRLGVVLDVNVASGAELTSLHGIGPALARRIVSARPFDHVADLIGVHGIGPATLARIRPRVRVTAQGDAR